MISFFVAGEPKPQPRPRPIPGGKGVYNPATANEWKAQVKAEAQKHRPATPIEGPVRVGLSFQFARPDSHFTCKKGVVALKPDAPFFHAKTPDCDNLEKAVLDAITALGGYWPDDAAVAWISTRKLYAGPGCPTGCMIQITEAKP
jgi:Holliday junction resolvase RusA-like endonuclease